MSSRLFIAAYEENSQVAYGVSIDNSEYNSSGLFVIQTILRYIMDDDDKVEKTVGIIINELKKLCSNDKPVDQEELNKAKDFLKGNLTCS